MQEGNPTISRMMQGDKRRDVSLGVMCVVETHDISEATVVVAYL
jgi:hypothetical protein